MENNFSIISDKLSNFGVNFETFQKETNEKFIKVEEKLEEKASINTCDQLSKRLDDMESKLNFLYDRANRDSVMKESYSKRLNILIHGLPENEESPWEKRKTTLEIFKTFLKNGLQIQDPSEIRIADIHRLPQRPVYRNKKRKCRPIIVKLTSAMDKSKVFRLTKHLKEYNDSNYEASSSSGSQSTQRTVYITDYLPRIFYLQKQQLMKDKADLKTMWKVEDGSYNLYVDGVKVNPNTK